MTISELTKNARERLQAAFPAREAEWMVREAMQHVFARSRVQLIVDGQKEAAPVRIDLINDIVDRLLSGEPLQQILGFEWFMGLKLAVTPDVLVPRPETEQLVEMIISREGRNLDLRVLDVGTGSGCIALALARNLKFPKVTGIDISSSALGVARKNASSLKVANAEFLLGDILTLPVPDKPCYDIIVSNPPYIMESERAAMARNVLEHEPHGALFVPDSDPLKFYLAVARYAAGALVPGGRLYFELNPLTAEMLREQLTSAGWASVEISDDERGKKRFLRAVKPADE